MMKAFFLLLIYNCISAQSMSKSTDTLYIKFHVKFVRSTEFKVFSVENSKIKVYSIQDEHNRAVTFTVNKNSPKIRQKRKQFEKLFDSKIIPIEKFYTDGMTSTLFNTMNVNSRPIIFIYESEPECRKITLYKASINFDNFIEM